VAGKGPFLSKKGEILGYCLSFFAEFKKGIEDMELDIIIFVVFGFAAQMIDGVSARLTGFLRRHSSQPGVLRPSRRLSTQRKLTTGSGISHFKFGNVDRKIFAKLLIPGVIGGVLGAYILTEVPGGKIRPFVSIYLLIMGLMILFKVFKKIHKTETKTRLIPLGLVVLMPLRRRLAVVTTT
jgi:uncharacterized membrane protein YfcA